MLHLPPKHSKIKMIGLRRFKINQNVSQGYINDDPLKGYGKPEPLSGNCKGYRSRLINKEHRLVYKIFDTHILVIKCKRHYEF